MFLKRYHRAMQALSALTPRPNRLLSRAIATVDSHLHQPGTNDFRQRVYELLTLAKTPLSESDMARVEECLTSAMAGDFVALGNHHLFMRFLEDQERLEWQFIDTALSGLADFQGGWMHRHRHLSQLAERITQFSQNNAQKEPLQFGLDDVYSHIQERQSLATEREGLELFQRACTDWQAQILASCWNTRIPTDLCYDPERTIIGGWNEKGIVWKEIVRGLKPIWRSFFGDAITVPCADKNGELSLVEFDPRGFPFLQWARNHLSIIGSEHIGERGVPRTLDRQDELFYCLVNQFWSPKVIHSGPGRTIVSNKPLRKIQVGRDILFIAHESSGSCAMLRIHSLQTGSMITLEVKNIEKEEESPDNIIFHLRQRDSFSGTIRQEWKEDAQWRFGRSFPALKSVSLRELGELWQKVSREAKRK